MKRHVNGFKHLVAAGVLGIGLLAAGRASAFCTNDVDCPTPACGGQVCDWPSGRVCQAAKSGTHGTDGWCTVDSDCKCASLGATCNGATSQCTFTTAADKPGAATGGASGSTGGATGSTGGTTGSTGGAAAGTGGSSAGTDGGTAAAKDSGGCAVASGGASSGIGVLIGLAAFVASRRRRAAISR